MQSYEWESLIWLQSCSLPEYVLMNKVSSYLFPVFTCCFRSYAPWLLRCFISSSCLHSAGFWQRHGSPTWQWQAASGIASYASVSCVSAGVGFLSLQFYLLSFFLRLFTLFILFFFLICFLLFSSLLFYPLSLFPSLFTSVPPISFFFLFFQVTVLFLPSLCFPSCCFTFHYLFILFFTSFYVSCHLPHNLYVKVHFYFLPGLPALVVAISVGFTKAKGYGTSS